MPGTAAQKLPFLYNLPADLHEVRVMAYAQALECAHRVLSEERVFTDQEVQVMAINAAIGHERLELFGKQGANDGLLFRQTIIETFRQEYPGALEAMRTGAYAIMYGLPEHERATRFYLYAREHLVV
jgi:hypothetical protein